ncbi:hypothetical protein ABZ949_34485 [Micromonospora tulbaghiae]|uniref:hypothetical protein n=1 Tax=Micromonospora tulbaghiae TaxID=479978 RepID=UPI0034008068
MQVLLIGFEGDEVPLGIGKKLKELRANDQIRALDVLTVLMRRNRTIERQSGADLLPAAHSGELLDRLLRESSASAVMGESTSGGKGYLFEGDDIPQLRDSMRAGTGVVALLLEHRWAIPLRDAVVNSEAFPVRDGWVGRRALQRLELIAER